MAHTGSFWAKSWRDDAGELQTHALICHLLDVGVVAEQLIRRSPRRIGDWVASLFPSLSSEKAWRLMAAIVALHDIGKLSPGFQGKVDEAASSLRSLGFEFSPGAEPNHGIVSLVVLKQFLPKLLQTDNDSCAYFADAIAGHHGSFLRTATPGWVGDGNWEAERDVMISLVMRAFGVSQLTGVTVSELTASSVCLLAGLTSMTDWIGSDDEYFTFHSEVPEILDSYIGERLAIASDRIEAYGLYECGASSVVADFSELFDGKKPHALQRRVIDMVKRAEAPFLVIAETPTGSGKTEAILGAYANLVSGKKRPAGLYYALPTRTTGNQMFGRVKDFLEKLYSDRQPELHLLHGEAAYVPEFEQLRIGRVYDSDGDESEGGVRASRWFAGRKKGLLAEHGVGTIDQAMLASMQVRHFFVRLFGLADKVLILDELHAYDDYMEQIIDRLVEWMKAIGTSVVILSATLPRAKKRALLTSFGAQLTGKELHDATYPTITMVEAGGELQVDSVPSPSERSIQIALHESDAETKVMGIAQRASMAAETGGCIGVIVNTVDEAQSVYSELSNRVGHEDVPLYLLHARLSRERRRIVETEISQMLGPNAGSRRPERAIVVATQVIEQSVDFDFDRMLTDIAPVDLLLQRAGRLHRRQETVRPEDHNEPVLEISVPPTSDRFDFGKAAFVYDQLILARTRLVIDQLCNRDQRLLVPGDVTRIIEDVYAGDPADAVEAKVGVELDRPLRETESRTLSERFSARVAALPSIVHRDDPEVLDDLRSLADSDDRPSTRLNADSITLVIMENADEIPGPLDRRSVRTLLERSVPLSLSKWIKHFREQRVPEAWKKNAQLSFTRPLYLTNGEYRCELGVLTYDETLGLRAIKKEDVE